MTDTSRGSGADLARQALAAARAAAKNTPPAGRKQHTTRPTRSTRGGGRDPLGLGGVLKRLAEEQGWDDGLGGGNILDQWRTLCPSALVDLLTPTGYDPERRLLTLRPAHPAAAAQARLFQQQLVKHLNEQLGRPAVHTVRVLPPGGAPAAAERTDPAPATSAPQGPAKTRETASPGYRAALDAVLTHRPERQHTDPYVLEAMQRQEAALRSRRQAESEHREAEWELDRLASQHVDRSEAVRRAAIARKRAEQAGREPRRLFGAA
ncbi:DciA family protein [Streptomyces sp. NPDC003395]